MQISQDQNKITIGVKEFEFIDTTENGGIDCHLCVFLHNTCLNFPCMDRDDEKTGYFKLIKE